MYLITFVSGTLINVVLQEPVHVGPSHVDMNSTAQDCHKHLWGSLGVAKDSVY